MLWPPWRGSNRGWKAKQKEMIGLLLDLSLGRWSLGVEYVFMWLLMTNRKRTYTAEVFHKTKWPSQSICPSNTYESVVERVTKVIKHRFFFIRIIPSVESVFIFRYHWNERSLVLSSFCFLKRRKKLAFHILMFQTYQENVFFLLFNIKWKITLEVYTVPWLWSSAGKSSVGRCTL